MTGPPISNYVAYKTARVVQFAIYTIITKRKRSTRREYRPDRGLEEDENDQANTMEVKKS